MKLDYYTCSEYESWIEEGVFHIIYHCEILTLSIAIEAVNMRINMCKNLSYPMFADIRQIKNIAPGVRQYLAVEQNINGISAGALLICSQFHQVIGNFFIIINKPPIPAKLFSNRLEAIVWLQQFKTSVPI